MPPRLSQHGTGQHNMLGPELFILEMRSVQKSNYVFKSRP